MCGICGILNGKESHKLIYKMNQSLRHRGPDNEDVYIDENISLGHTRLSIIDLSENGNQPMHLDNMVIVFNGEIYNYIELKDELKLKGVVFKTQTDTEVLLWAYKIWGKNCLDKLNGMFSFTIWNKDSKELFCARDHFGIKPFYYMEHAGSFVFASEIKSILAVYQMPSPNYKVIKEYLMQGSYGSPSETFFENIKALEPGHYMVVDAGGIKFISSYWKISDNSKFQENEEESAMSQYLDIMANSIKLRLRSDVPIGLNISGGLDSSALLGIIDYYYKHQTSFHVYTYTCGDIRYDECQFVEQLLKGKDHKWHKCFINKSEFYDDFKNMQFFLDEPFGGLPTLAHSKIFKSAIDDGIKVLLCGEGMDEQWCGYDYYMDALNGQNVNDISVIQNIRNSFAENFLDKDFAKGYDPISYSLPFDNNIDNLKYRDIFFTKIPRSLRIGDRISMAFGRELRIPFLDHRLVELSFKMPVNFMIRDGIRKYLLRKLVDRKFSYKMIDSPKRALQTPQREWLREDLEWVKDILSSDSFRRRGIFDIKRVWDIYQKYQNGCFDNSFFLWQWLNLEIWFRTFID